MKNESDLVVQFRGKCKVCGNTLHFLRDDEWICGECDVNKPESSSEFDWQHARDAEEIERLLKVLEAHKGFIARQDKVVVTAKERIAKLTAVLEEIAEENPDDLEIPAGRMRYLAREALAADGGADD